MTRCQVGNSIRKQKPPKRESKIKVNGHQAVFILLKISENRGLFPCINIFILNILMERDSPPTMESPNTPILVRICQMGISDTPSLTMVWTGAVTGNMVSTTQMELLGKAMSNDENQSGIKLDSV